MQNIRTKAVCAFAFIVMAMPMSSATHAAVNTAESCTDKLYGMARGKSEAQLFALSKQVFDYTYAGRRAASRNQKNWDSLPQTTRDAYMAKLILIAKKLVIPGLKDNLGQKPKIKRSYVDNGLLKVIYASGDMLVLNPNNCDIVDAKAYGVSLSTLAAEALKN